MITLKTKIDLDDLVKQITADCNSQAIRKIIADLSALLLEETEPAPVANLSGETEPKWDGCGCGATPATGPSVNCDRDRYYSLTYGCRTGRTLGLHDLTKVK